MHAIALEMARTMTVLSRNRDLRDYARWEYRTSDPTWLVVTARRPSRRRRPVLAGRVRTFLARLRTPAALDAGKAETPSHS